MENIELFHIATINNPYEFFDSVIDALRKFGNKVILPIDSWFFIADILSENPNIFAKIVDADAIVLNSSIDMSFLGEKSLLKRNFSAFRICFDVWLQMNFLGKQKEINNYISQLEASAIQAFGNNF
jgi:hypothetical protein